MTHARRTTSLLAAAALGLALTGGLAACGGDAEPTAAPSVPASKPFNDADVAFATDMVPHHAQALAMVDLTRGRDLDPPVRELAQQVLDAQGPEIQTMAGWLQDWDQPVPATMRDHAHADSGDMGGMDADMPGMMSAREMHDLEEAPDADFQRQWLEMMVEHHEGAVRMARTEEANGEYADATALARSIVDGQEQQIATMEELLAG